MKSTKYLAVAAIAPFVATNAWATNAMNMEGYGPISTAMGGTGFAFDTGAAAVMINPATLGLMDEGQGIELAIGMLGPDITASATAGPAMGASSSSTADQFWMPAFGYTRKMGNLAYGIGVFAQGGMGTEYDGTEFLAGGSGETVRSEVGVGRAAIPIAFNVNDKLTVGGSLDFVWAGMDLKMAVPSGMMAGMIQPGSDPGAIVVANLLANNDPASYGRFDFSDNNPMTGDAMGYGYAGKIGLTYEINPMFTLGLTYHSQTQLGDLETDGAVMTMGNPGGGVLPAPTVAIDGKLSVQDFQWPDLIGVGVAMRPNDKWLLAFDYSRVGWSSVMDTFKMKFTPDAGQMISAPVYLEMPQEWDDQDVFKLGAAYQVSDTVAIRAGYNYAKNPVPDTYVNALFPAIVETHLTGGFGWLLMDNHNLDVSFTYAPEVDVTNSSDGTKITHSQFSWQIGYKFMF
ncbi:MAG: aromatic hydrocarbon degradation protein [Gammaproteobacteria bacterium]|nr:aromatic hydrocarbon degradation protein [Gammaproteobacteria bacterium]